MLLCYVWMDTDAVVVFVPSRIYYGQFTWDYFICIIMLVCSSLLYLIQNKLLFDEVKLFVFLHDSVNSYEVNTDSY